MNLDVSFGSIILSFFIVTVGRLYTTVGDILSFSTASYLFDDELYETSYAPTTNFVSFCDTSPLDMVTVHPLGLVPLISISNLPSGNPAPVRSPLSSISYVPFGI